MTQRPRLLHLTTTAISLDWLLSPQLVAFEQAGFEVVAASGGGAHVASLEALGISHHNVPSLSRRVDFRADLRAMRDLHRLFARLRPDIVHTHNPKPGVLGRLVGRASRAPIVVNTVHGLYAQRSDPFLRRTAVYGAERVAASCSDAELVQNVEDVETLIELGIPRQRVHLLGNGIDLRRFTRRCEATSRHLRHELGIDGRVPVVGMVGRLVWEKGYGEFFDAVARLRAEGAAFEVIVVGPTEPDVAGAVDRAAMARMELLGVRFLGSRTDVDDLLNVIDIFALPSHREGFPRAAMEASAAGVPVVATDVRGCRQVVRHGETGFLVAPRSGAELAHALRVLLLDPQLRSQMGEAACRLARAEFDQERVIARTLAVYRQLLRKSGVGPPQPSTERYIDSIDLVAFEASNRLADARAA